MPGGGSQQGFAVMLANPDVLKGKAPVCILEAQSNKVRRRVRSSMAVEAASATQAFEHGDYVRAALGELCCEDFKLRNWRAFVGRWPQYAVMDAKCVHDSLLSDSLPSDRRTALDIQS